MLYFKAVRSSFDDLKFKIFQGYSLFSYQCSFVVLATLICYHIHSCLSTTFLFYFVYLVFQEINERRRRDLNPRAAVNDLHPFQGCPFGQLGYFSELFTIIHLPSICQIQLCIDERRGWDSNPCALADKRFSRPPRYDHFDTSPCFALESVQKLFYHP